MKNTLKKNGNYLITIMDAEDNILHTEDTSEVAVGIASGYQFDFRSIKKRTGKWPVKIKFEFIEELEVSDGK